MFTRTHPDLHMISIVRSTHETFPEEKNNNKFPSGTVPPHPKIASIAVYLHWITIIKSHIGDGLELQGCGLG